jgi:hypothetical protein
MWTGLVWLRIGTGGELLWIPYWTFGFHEMLGNYRVASRLVFSSIELLNHKRTVNGKPYAYLEPMRASENCQRWGEPYFAVSAISIGDILRKFMKMIMNLRVPKERSVKFLDWVIIISSYRHIYTYWRGKNPFYVEFQLVPFFMGSFWKVTAVVSFILQQDMHRPEQLVTNPEWQTFWS